MAFSTYPGRGPRAEINITPMIDVLLVLMIIFIVIAPTQSVGIPALVPQPSTSDGKPPDPGKYVVLSINERKAIRLNTELIAVEDLGARLKRLFGAAPNGVLFVKAPGNLDYQIVAQVMDIAQGAGVAKIAMTTEQPDTLEFSYSEPCNSKSAKSSCWK